MKARNYPSRWVLLGEYDVCCGPMASFCSVSIRKETPTEWVIKWKGEEVPPEYFGPGELESVIAQLCNYYNLWDNEKFRQLLLDCAYDEVRKYAEKRPPLETRVPARRPAGNAVTFQVRHG